jgi:hypothetical protein
LLHGTKRKVLALSVRAYAIAMGDAPFGYFMWERHSPEWRLGIANREIGVPGGQKPKRGTWRLPVSALLVFAVAAPISASGGTHRVRGVMAAVCVLSPVESTSPPQLFEQQFRSTPMAHFWQVRLCDFHKQKISTSPTP